MKKGAILKSRAIHKALKWVALIAVVVFVVSAICHPLMSWFGPQAIKHRPPAMQFPAAEAANFQNRLNQALEDLTLLERKDLTVVKVVPTQHGPMLQLSGSTDEIRNYVPLRELEGLTVKDVKNYDLIQAEWLARYFTGSTEPINSVQFITEFNPEYPWINRLLPVFKVNFSGDEALTAYVHTETGSLAAMNNQFKLGMQSVFRAFHTFSWLEGFPFTRVLVISALLSALVVMLISGLLKLILINRSKQLTNRRKVHRRVAAWLLLPFAGLLFSGFYHLFQSEYGDNYLGMSWRKVGLVSQDAVHIPPIIAGKSINSLSFVSYEGSTLGRVSVASDVKAKGTKTAIRKERFKGIATEESSWYFDLASGGEVKVGDKEIASFIASEFLGVPQKSVLSVEKVVRFGPEYDFRNKRLPVYKVSFATEFGDKVFVDAQTGIVVDRLVNTQRYERLSFSMLHKWNFLTPLLGRQGRDIVVVAALLGLMLLAVFGIAVRRKVYSGT